VADGELENESANHSFRAFENRSGTTPASDPQRTNTSNLSNAEVGDLLGASSDFEPSEPVADGDVANLSAVDRGGLERRTLLA
jgi:hypothetical protein